MDGSNLLIKYLIGTGVFLVFVLLAVSISLMQHRRRSWARSIFVHSVQFLVWLGAIVVARNYVNAAIEDYHVTWLTQRLVNVVAVFVALCALMSQLVHLINRMEQTQVSKGHDRTSAHMIGRVLKFSAFVILMLLFGEHFGMSVSGLLAFGGIGGIAIGMASKDILSNVFSGTMLYFDRQFNIGDWISSPDRNIEGTVEEIGWRLTKIKTFDNRPLFVPNSLFSSISVENPGRMTHRRISTEIALRYEDAQKVAAIVDDIRQMLRSNSAIDTTQDLLVYFNAFASSSLNVMVYCFTKTTKWGQWLQVQQDVYLQIIEIVKKHDADFAYPSQTVYVHPSQGPALSDAPPQEAR